MTSSGVFASEIERWSISAFMIHQLTKWARLDRPATHRVTIKAKRQSNGGFSYEKDDKRKMAL